MRGSGLQFMILLLLVCNDGTNPYIVYQHRTLCTIDLVRLKQQIEEHETNFSLNCSRYGLMLRTATLGLT
jgi:hypothetical protein